MNEAIRNVNPRTRDWLTLIGVGGILYGLFGPDFTILLAILFVGGLLYEVRNHLIPKEKKEEEEETDDRRSGSTHVR